MFIYNTVLEAFSQISAERFLKWCALYDKKHELKNLAIVIKMLILDYNGLRINS
jgi:hypothetical protein